MPGGIDGNSEEIRGLAAGGSEKVFNLPVRFPKGISGSGVTPVYETPTGTINGTNRTFTFSSAPDSSKPILIFSDAVLVDPGEYTVLGTALTFGAGSLNIPASGLKALFYI